MIRTYLVEMTNPALKFIVDANGPASAQRAVIKRMSTMKVDRVTTSEALKAINSSVPYISAEAVTATQPEPAEPTGGTDAGSLPPAPAGFTPASGDPTASPADASDPGAPPF